MAEKFDWLRKRRKTELELPYEPPICLTDKSNGEFYWRQTPHERRVREQILHQADDNARKLGMDRREFLASAMGMATSLSVLNLASGCGDSEDTDILDAGPDSGTPTGGYCIPKGTTLDCDAANELLGGNEFIFDLQTHHIVDEEMWRETHPGEAYSGESFYRFWDIWHASCPTRDSNCIGPDQYLEDIYMNSDTTVGVLSGYPSEICDDASLCNALISNNDMVATRDRVNALASSQRVVQHCQVMPNSRLDLQLEMMERIHAEHGNHGWKCYPPAGSWWLDDEDSGIPFIEKARELTANDDGCGPPRALICAHKGLPLQGFSREHGDPKDVMVVAKRFPDVDFIVYHSAIHHMQNANTFASNEGPYDPDGEVDAENPTNYPVDRSANILVHRVVENDLKGKNVYAELGSAWMLVMNYPTAAGHLIGKLLKYVGEDNVLWGSECIWFASPQPQIEAFRAFQIPEELRDLYGYPELTPQIKAKIFGLNAARLYGVDPDVKRCEIAEDRQMASVRQQMDGELGKRRWAFQSMKGPRTPREFRNLVRWERFKDGLG